MSLWQQTQEIIGNTFQSTKAIAVDSVETFHHHRALSLNKQADTIGRAEDIAIDATALEGAVTYLKTRAAVAASNRHQSAVRRQQDDKRFTPENKMMGIYDAVTSDLDTLKEAGGVLWGHLKTADTLARAIVKDTRKDLEVALNSPDGQMFKQAAEDTLQGMTNPLQQVWQQTTDNIRSLDLGHKGQQIVQYFQELGKNR